MMRCVGFEYPERLPPSKDAAIQHSLRAYLHLFRLLGTREGEQHNYEPIGSIQNLISCSCETRCSTNKCSCKKNNIQCMSFCSGCRGSECLNSKTEEFKHDEDYEMDADVDDD